MENVTGQISDNKSDYYNGTPQHYTSVLRDIHKDGLLIVNEQTDAFAGRFNFAEPSDKASTFFNGETTILTKVEKSMVLKTLAGWNSKDIAHWSDVYFSEDKTVYGVVQRKKQVVLLGHLRDGTRTDYAFYLSRYLACKKLALMKQTQDAAVMASLVKLL
ncbi:hypothetical protein [Candidatus Ponderosibacter sp. Uisw_141_02]|uniref:hypothetical protein n=1 Tax=Candidatus Ponderosibacter sp. Uisw_141_02 TaxID=3231000 RepID=UPI003D42B942